MRCLVTKKRGGRWSCKPSLVYAVGSNAYLDIRKGDIFKLERRKGVPFVLTPKKQDISQLLSKCPDC